MRTVRHTLANLDFTVSCNYGTKYVIRYEVLPRSFFFRRVRLLACRKREPLDHPSRTSRGGDETNRHANQFNGSTEKRGIGGLINFFASRFLSRAVSSNRSNRILMGSRADISSIRERKREETCDLRGFSSEKRVKSDRGGEFSSVPRSKFASGNETRRKRIKRNESARIKRAITGVDHVEKPQKRIPDDYKQMRNRDETKCRIANNSLPRARMRAREP